MPWYHARTVTSEFWFGPAVTRDEAIAKGKLRHGSRFAVAEGKPFENDLDVFESTIAPVFDRFDSLKISVRTVKAGRCTGMTRHARICHAG
jgi:hypothetical protein